MKITFETPDFDNLIENAVRQHITETLAFVTCPVHRVGLEAVQIAGDSPDQLQLRMKACCDELLSAANQALGVSRVESDAGDSGLADGDANVSDSSDEQRRLRAFLCHASEDKDLVRKIAHDLHAAGIDTFLDEWEIRAGESLRQKIDQGLADCTHFVVVLTPISLRKPWVNAEIDAAFIRKVSGQAILIPLRYGLSVDQLPPLLAALLSPEIRDYDKDIRRLIDDIRGVARKPAVAAGDPATDLKWGRSLAISPLATNIARLIAQESKQGRPWDPQMAVEELKESTGGSDEDLIDAISELEDLGWAEPQRVIGAAPFGYHFVTPTERLFERVDRHVMGWDSAADAVRVAAEVANSGGQGLQSRVLAERLGWEPRRLNPALSYLVSRDVVLASKNIDAVFVTSHIAMNARTRRFVRDHAS